MTVGSGLFLIVVGAIIRYALDFKVAGVEEGTLGAILILAGIVVLVLGLIAAPFRLWAESRSNRVVVEDSDARYGRRRY